MELIQIFVYSGPFDVIFLLVVLIDLIVVLNVFSFFVVIVVEVPDSMAERTFMTVVDAEAPEEESTESLLLLWLFLHDILIL